jgi:hypothetical protein
MSRAATPFRDLPLQKNKPAAPGNARRRADGLARHTGEPVDTCLRTRQTQYTTGRGRL